MGVAIYIATKEHVAELSSLVDGKAVGRAFESLNKLSGRLGSKHLDHFVSANPEDLADVTGEDAADFPAEQWFPADDGLVLVNELIYHIEHDVNNPFPADVLTDLKSYRTAFSLLKNANVEWHFSVDI